MSSPLPEQQWLLNWFRRRNAQCQTMADESLSATNFLIEGLVDSFDVISLIADTELEFGIRLSDEDFQDQRFATIGGLVEIIRSKAKA